MKKGIFGIVTAVSILLVMFYFIKQSFIVENSPAQPIAIKTSGTILSITDGTPSKAIVKLENGSEVEATIFPGCKVLPGELVSLRVTQAGSNSSKLYLVIGNEPK